MLSFRLLLVLLIFKTVVYCNFGKSLYRTIVKGRFTCKNRAFGTFKVYIIEGSHSRREGRTLNYQFVRYGDNFLLDALTYSYWKPSMFVKIIHTCNTNKHECFKSFFIKIEPMFIKKVKRNQWKWKNSYNLGSYDLSTLPSVFLICPNRRRASE